MNLQNSAPFSTIGYLQMSEIRKKSLILFKSNKQIDLVLTFT